MQDRLFVIDTESRLPPNQSTNPPPSPLQSTSSTSPSKLTFNSLQDLSFDRLDTIDSAPSTRRYWKEPTGITCTICHEPDHSAKNCEHDLCLTCGAIDEHLTRLCPVSLVCFACGSRGHLSRHCPSSAESRILGKDCIRCGSINHLSLNCPSIWRCYEEIKISNRKPKPLVPSCYNCGSNGDHFGDECPFGRHGRSRPEPSAFSIRAYSTPHPSSHSRSHRLHPENHHRQDRSNLSSFRDSDYRSRDQFLDRPAPPSHHSRRPAPLPYEEEEEEDWFSKRNRTKKDIPTGPSKKASQSQKKMNRDHWEPRAQSSRKKHERVPSQIEIKTKVNGVGGERSQPFGRNGRTEEREAGKGDSGGKRHRIGGSYKGGYTRR
ncbi:hypothetical protein DFH28DRAFT_887066 [Melampsora americana]|nr:hypothetical protein DFH28DRAFT_887066 [Melampsora americana]